MPSEIAVKKVRHRLPAKQSQEIPLRLRVLCGRNQELLRVAPLPTRQFCFRPNGNKGHRFLYQLSISFFTTQSSVKKSSNRPVRRCRHIYNHSKPPVAIFRYPPQKMLCSIVAFFGFFRLGQGTFDIRHWYGTFLQHNPKMPRILNRRLIVSGV